MQTVLIVGNLSCCCSLWKLQSMWFGLTGYLIIYSFQHKSLKNFYVNIFLEYAGIYENAAKEDYNLLH